MTTREKRLAGFVGAVAAVGLAGKVVYPVAVEPLFDVEGEIAELEGDLADVLEERDRVDDALLEYKGLLERTGSVNPMAVKDRLQTELEGRLRAAGLETTERRVTPKRPAQDRKTGLSTVSLSLAAEGGLQPIIEFLKGCYELPYVARFKDLKLTPVSTKRQQKGQDSLKLTGTFEALVLPRDPLADGLIDYDSLEQPAEMVKHLGDTYAMIWERQPFSEHVKQRPAPVTKVEKPTVKPNTELPRATARPTGDPERNDKYIAGVLRGDTHELMVINNRHNTREYVPRGEVLDGGRLVYVHPLGGIVRKGDGDYFYELGKTLSEAVKVDQAGDIPGLQVVAVQLPDSLPFEDLETPPSASRPRGRGSNVSMTEPGQASAGEAAAKEPEPVPAADEESSEAAGTPKAGKTRTTPNVRNAPASPGGSREGRSAGRARSRGSRSTGPRPTIRRPNQAEPGQESPAATPAED